MLYRMLLTITWVFCIFTHLQLHKAHAESYKAHGSLGLALKPVDSSLAGPSGILYWLSFGDWRNDDGLASNFDITYDVTVDRDARTVHFTGTLPGSLRTHTTFTSVGKVEAELTYTLSGVSFDVDPLTKQTIFAIGRVATGTGFLKITSPDGTVDLGPTGELYLSLTDKYKQPGTNVDELYGPFSADPFNFYVGYRYIPGDLFFTGTEGRGYNGWIMFNHPVTLNGITFAAAGGDLHGDLTPTPEATCPNGVGIDRCGVCMGNGLSCCESFDQTDILRTLDSAAQKQSRIVKLLARIVRRTPPRRKNRTIANKAIEFAQSAAQSRWEFTWSNRANGMQCETTNSSCVDISTADSLRAYAILEADLLAIRTTLAQIAKNRSTKARKRVKTFKRRYDAAEAETAEALTRVKTQYSECSP